MANLTGMFQQLNQSLGSYGEGILGQQSTLPLEQQNAMQLAGVNNPLLQRFGMGLGFALGKDMSSVADQFKKAASQLDVNTTEGRSEYLSLLSRLNPEAAVKQAMAFKKADQDTALFEIDKINKKAQADKAAKGWENIYVPVTKMIPDPSDITGMRTIPSTSYIMVTVDKDGKPVADAGILQQAGVEPATINRPEVAYVENDKGESVMVRRSPTEVDFRDEEGNKYPAADVITQQNLASRRRKPPTNIPSIYDTPDDYRVAP